MSELPAVGSFWTLREDSDLPEFSTLLHVVTHVEEDGRIHTESEPQIGRCGGLPRNAPTGCPHGSHRANFVFELEGFRRRFVPCTTADLYAKTWIAWAREHGLAL